MRLNVCLHASSLLGLCLALSFAPLPSSALTQGDYTYTTNVLGQATITGFNKNYNGTLLIANTLSGCPVVSIGTNAFYLCTALTSVTFPSGVTEIGASAFGGCYSLTSVTIPNTVTNIGSASFSGTSLASVNIPDSVLTIGYSAFNSCTSITNA